MSISKKRRKDKFVTLSPTRIEVTDFNKMDSQILSALEHAVGSGRKCIEGIQNKDVDGWCNLDNKGGTEKGL
jgi:hypothetical protein